MAFEPRGLPSANILGSNVTADAIKLQMYQHAVGTEKSSRQHFVDNAEPSTWKASAVRAKTRSVRVDHHLSVQMPVQVLAHGSSPSAQLSPPAAIPVFWGSSLTATPCGSSDRPARWLQRELLQHQVAPGPTNLYRRPGRLLSACCPPCVPPHAVCSHTNMFGHLPLPNIPAPPPTRGTTCAPAH